MADYTNILLYGCEAQQKIQCKSSTLFNLVHILFYKRGDAMEKDYRVFTIRRLFKEDMEQIKDYSRNYDNLYFNPLTDDYIWQVMLQGAFWAVYDGEKLSALTYILPADSPAFACLDASCII